MKSRSLFYGISILAIIAVLAVFLVYGLSPPNASNEIFVVKGYTDWSLDNGRVIHGESVWASFADYEGDETIQRSETIKVYNAIYWGAILFNKAEMSWETETGSYSIESLTLNDLKNSWQDGASVFKYTFEEDYFRVSFSIPKLKNGEYKFSDLTEAWEEGQLYQTIEKW